MCFRIVAGTGVLCTWAQVKFKAWDLISRASVCVSRSLAVTLTEPFLPRPTSPLAFCSTSNNLQPIRFSTGSFSYYRTVLQRNSVSLRLFFCWAYYNNQTFVKFIFYPRFIHVQKYFIRQPDVVKFGHLMVRFFNDCLYIL